MKRYRLLALGAAVALTGCGGGSSGEGPVEKTDDARAEIGVLVDSPVTGIGYRTETESGITNSAGEFQYREGENVTFFIGEFEFPEATAADILTPLDMAGTSDVSNPVVINIVRLLQSLDEDGNPDNGITISEQAAGVATTRIDLSLSVADFAVSDAVTTLVANSGSTNVTVISEEQAIAHFDSTLNQIFAIDLREITATSVITFSSCPGVPGGWDYSFTNTSMTLSGSDGWQSPECTLNDPETFSLPMTGLDSDFDIPFNCQDYPICRLNDFEKTLSGTDQDEREFTSTFTFDRLSLTMTYVKNVEGTTFTEVITIGDPNFVIDMSERVATSVITFSSCPDAPGGWDYSFTNTTMALSGSDGWQSPECTLNEPETFSLTMANLGSDFDIPFNCQDYPICRLDDFRKILSGKDQDGRDFTSTFTFNQSSLTMTYVKNVEGTTFTEVINIE